MKLTILGSGTSVPHPHRAASAYLLEVNNKSILLDAGADAAHRMAEENLDWSSLDAIWISHFHLDHTGGLAPLLFGTKYAPQTQARRKPLVIFGPRGTSNLLRAFDEANSYELLKQPFPVEIREVEPGREFEIVAGLAAHTFSTPHTTESLALRLTDAKNLSFVYTSDTGYTDALASFARKAELLLAECSFRQVKPVETHLNLAEAMRMARAAEPGRVILTHLYPEWDNVDISAEAKKHWPGETAPAADGLRLDIAGGE